MFGILKFQTFLLVVLLFICSCTYLHGVFPAWLDRNKTGPLGTFWRAARVGERLSPRPDIPMADGFVHPTGMPWLTSTKLESRTETSPEPISYFDRIPAETRNQISELVLGEEGEIDINATGGWPAILSAWKQLGDEAAPMYLRNANFTVTILDLNSSALVNWLTRFEQVPAGLKALVKGVKIICLGDMIDCDIGGYGHPLYSANLDYWDGLINNISASGLKDHQLQWPGLVDLDLSISKTRASHPDSRRYWVGVEKHMLNKYILTPLLGQRGMFNNAAPPVNVLQQVRRECLQLGLDRQCAMIIAQETQFSTLGIGDGWFDSWQMSKLMMD
ncbi:hypothetical protein LTR37_019919 [Vermiconidia calcicola]|uniref:Uncharacterized protein n=1 Tax=Vermiconidia calcicola TaxID=1690605 RepID=A0ACC3MDZ4_9PEZI|nr:hypothetical protein LTR37_019919 [Vermiconidia calcicola]